MSAKGPVLQSCTAASWMQGSEGSTARACIEPACLLHAVQGLLSATARIFCKSLFREELYASIQCKLLLQALAAPNAAY